MNRYIMIRRLRGPAYVLLVGALALLNQMDIISWGKSWPFFLILEGLLQVSERAILALDGGHQPPPVGTPPTAAYTSPYSYPGQPVSSINATPATEPVKGAEGVQS